MKELLRIWDEKDRNGEVDWGEYEDAIINSRYAEADVVRQFLGKRDKYGEFKYAEIDKKQFVVETLAEDWNLDILIAKGIYTGIAIAEPAYEEYGERFLQEVLPGYRKSEYAVDLMKSVLSGIISKRNEAILKGIYELIELGESDIPESIPVKVMMDEYRLLDGYKRAEYVSDIIFTELMHLFADNESLEELNQNIKVLEENVGNWKKKAIEQKWIEEVSLVEKNPECIEYLRYMYNYYMEHTEEIPEDFKKSFKHIDKKEKLVAIYVTTRPETGIEQFVRKKNSQLF